MIGLLLCFYPCVASVFAEGKQKSVMEIYKEDVGHMKETELKENIEYARQYNIKLAEGECPGNYGKYLNCGKEGVMGILRIPCMEVILPIYHGTEEEVLEKGVGHIQNSSFPVGGISSHCLLAGHRGLPDAKIFTDLGKVGIGELIFLDVFGETYCYQVTEIQTIRPEETDILQIRENEDLLSLITCTPYGINTHRLVVTGVRVNEK